MTKRKKINIKLILFLTLLGLIGTIAIIPYQMTTLNNVELPQEVDVPVQMMIIINIISQTFTLLIFIFIGERCMHRTGLSAPIIDAWLHKREVPRFQKNWVILAIVVSFFGTLLTILMDRFIFMPNIEIPDGAVAIPAWWQGLLAMFYGGFTEELIVRFFAMTLIVWLLAIITRKDKASIPAVYFYIGIFLAALLFGIGHLPTAAQVFGGLSSLIVVRTLLLNGLLGLWFGYLYWKKGLEYAFIAHMAADVFLHVVFNPLFN